MPALDPAPPTSAAATLPSKAQKLQLRIRKPGAADRANARLVDVAQFRILPGAGAPQVAAKIDATLGKTGVFPWLLSQIEGVGRIGASAANGLRFMTRLLGPGMYGLSAFLNLRRLPAALKDPTLNRSSKTILTLGTIGTVFGAVTATIAALPASVAGMLRLAGTRQVMANKISCIAGGVSGLGFAAINMIETLRDPQSKPAERLFARAGFTIGLVGFVSATTALVLSMAVNSPAIAAWSAAAPWLLPLASQLATVAGVLGLSTWLGQLAFGKSAWLNAKLVKKTA